MDDFRTTTHACIRMCERAFGIDNPTPKQLEHASNVITKELIEQYSDEISRLRQGSFPLNDYGVYAALKDMKVLTIKIQRTKENSKEVNGGRRNKSNNTRKKYSTQEHNPDEKDFFINKKKHYKRKEPRPRE